MKKIYYILISLLLITSVSADTRFDLIEDKVVRLHNVGSAGAIIVGVDGVVGEIPRSGTRTINGLEITNIEPYYASTKLERAAKIGIKGTIETKEVFLQVSPPRESFFLSVKEEGISCKESTRTDPEGKTCRVKLMGVEPSGVITVRVDGVVGEIPRSETRTINGLEITNIEPYYASTKLERAAKIGIKGLDKEQIQSISSTVPVGEVLQPTQEYINCVLEALEPLPTKYDYNRVLTTCESYKSIRSKYLNCLFDVNIVGWGIPDKVVNICGLCGNGACNEGVENEQTCSQDCKGTATTGIVQEETIRREGCIVNGICEPEYGENEVNCQDCIKITIPLQCDGCVKNGSCLNFGMRIIENDLPKYCGFDKTFKYQKQAEEICQNNFECSSNLCVADKCVSPGLWQRIMEWFVNIFGYVVKK